MSIRHLPPFMFTAVVVIAMSVPGQARAADPTAPLAACVITVPGP